MVEHSFKLPDIGEGIAEAELACWMVKPGDIIREDDVICEVTTDKASVEIPAAVGGRVVWLGAEPGETIAIGSELIRIESDANAPIPEIVENPPGPEPALVKEAAKTATIADKAPPAPAHRDGPHVPARGATGRPLAAPSVRGRARDMGVDLRQIRGSGPAGRILHEDLDAFLARGPESPPPGALQPRDATEEIRITGVRRKISERMSLSKSRIPHFSIIEEVDVEALEELRAKLNARFGETRGRLTVLPFLLRALSEAVLDHPEVNAHYDDEAGLVTRYQALHCGIATQTDSGLMVPVLRHAEQHSLWDVAAGIRRLSDAARTRRSLPEELSGSTLTVTSLGPLGAIATTPIINHPEVAIVGVNKIAIRPMWNGTAFVPRRMMNLSCSFDHRVVDGWVAAEFVQKLKSLLETPAMMFMELGND
ncbi:dihydrolipoamide acetyltransferase family protein [Paracoccus seriniphilus]|uniref:Dihydrolipoamide acetyltransferase component of pyruvate dehydrogenase complex n=1 Tax=Paracoccus seriniphilus TaxID=184748 RepID=A0A239Q128_9RHOB|nr:dihydrolipoamide acetyltransferase family protein [Paracoccus seriniphilus]WCR15746.1 2-oxo acid dehydrogenase subunit E2 [Paracoccus seriniphilus]SNT76214.1 branched-chain alpha-keto acid dehydrogenase E2 component [Paracoccus seriniphilus]